MRKLKLYAPALALLVWVGCADTSGCLDVTSNNFNTNDNRNAIPSPTVTPTPLPCLPTGATCVTAFECCGLVCQVGVCL